MFREINNDYRIWSDTFTVWTGSSTQKLHYLTEEEYQEYQDLKKFKEDAEKEIKEIDSCQFTVNRKPEWEINGTLHKEHNCFICSECGLFKPMEDIGFIGSGCYCRDCNNKSIDLCHGDLKCAVQGWNCPQENRHCSCTHVPYELGTRNEYDPHVTLMETDNLLNNKIRNLKADVNDTFELVEDRIDDIEGEINTLKNDLADSDYSTVKFMKGQRINNEHFLTAIEGLADGMEGLYRIVNELTARKEDVQPKSKPKTKRSPAKPVEKSTRSK